MGNNDVGEQLEVAIAENIRLEARVVELESLQGATRPPADGVEISDAGQFAAVWNAWSPADRERVLTNMQETLSRGLRCFMADHESEIETMQQRLVGLMRQLDAALELLADVGLKSKADAIREVRA